MHYTSITFGFVLVLASHLSVAQPETPILTFPTECAPKIEVSSLSGQYNSAVEQQIEEIYQADQADRQIMTKREPTSDEAMKIFTNDFNRRQKVYSYIAKGQVASGQAFHQAAFIFQHGDCSAHYKFASELAAKAIELGYEKNKWIYAAALDRYLISVGKREKFGTQTTGGCPDEREFYDLETTDEERAIYDVLTLAELKNREPYYCD